MIRDPAREQLHRLTVKALDQVFIMRVKEGLGCSQFEAEALTGLVKEVYFPWLSHPEAIQAGQLAMTAVSADEPGHKPLSQCKMVPVVLTLYAGEDDHRYRLSQGHKGVPALRQRQIERMAHEALDQGALLTAEDFAFRIFNCGLRTISRDLKAMTDRGVVVPLRSQQKDAGRALSHRVQAVELYLKRHTFTQIRQRIYHSLSAIANYVVTFSVVVAHTRDGHSVDEIAFLMQISPTLVRRYQELYEHYNTPEYQERIDEIIATVRAHGFRPNQLDNASGLPAGEKKGAQQ
jgi:rRNA-processing protein FCF1